MAVSVELDAYTGEAPITVLGSVTPAPSASAFATVMWINPQGVTVATNTVPLDSLGDFQTTTLAGCSPAWTPGTYTVTASAVNSGGTASARTTFQYSLGLASADNVTTKVSPTLVPLDGTVTISGKVTACSGSVNYTSVLILVKNPAGATIFQDVVTPGGAATFGNYSDILVTGGTAGWTPGVYIVTSQYRSSSTSASPAFATATFVYGQNASSSTIQTPSQTSAAQNPAATLTSSSPTSTAPIGALPILAYAAVALAAGVAGAFVALRRRRKSS